MYLGEIPKVKQGFMDVSEAIKRGIQYLTSKNSEGHWSGFSTLAGTSDIWVTGFILTHMQKLSLVPEVVQSAQQFLLCSQHPTGGWSYSGLVPPDADSTSWAMMALENHPDFNGTIRQKAQSFLWGNRTGSGIATYGKASGIREFIAAPTEDLLAGWMSPHPDVSAAAVLADPGAKYAGEIMAWLESIRYPDGYLKSYWWRSPMYATALFLRCRHKMNKRLPKEWIQGLEEWMLLQQLADGGFGVDGSMDAFVTALALEIVVYLFGPGSDEKSSGIVNVLLTNQQTDGSWPGSYNMRIPAPFVLDPEKVDSYNNADIGGNSLVLDDQGLFATVMACHALSLYAGQKNNT